MATLGHGKSPTDQSPPHPSRGATFSSPTLQAFHSWDFVHFTCRRGLSKKEEAKSATMPTHQCSSIVPPYQLQLASPQQKYVTNDLNQLLFLQQYFTLPSATFVISTLQTLDTATVSMVFVPLCHDISIVLDLQHNYHQHSSTM
jgi:hypothetical protein